MTARERAIALGIDPDDPKYEIDPHAPLTGGDWCTWCHRHTTYHSRLRCDIQQAEAPEGAIACCRCQEPTLDTKRKLCQKHAQQEDAERKRFLRAPRFARSSTLRASDGCGCVESVSSAERDMYPDRFRS